MTSQQLPGSYQVRIRGHLGPVTSRAFPGLNVETQAGDTLLRGVADQAALYGVLARIEDLGLELLEVRRQPANRCKASR